MHRTDRLLRKHLRTTYLVTLTGDEAFIGVLVDHDLEHLVFADASTLYTSGERIPVSGQLWIPRTNVRYMQVAGSGETL